MAATLGGVILFGRFDSGSWWMWWTTERTVEGRAPVPGEPWLHVAYLAGLCACATAVVALLVARRGGTHDVSGDLRVLGLLLALGSGYVLDDGAAVTLRASPYGLARRLWLRIGCAAAVVTPLWMAMLAYLLPSAPASDRWALGLGLTVELAAALTVVWAIAAWGRRRGVEHPGIITTPALLASLFMAASISRAPVLVGLGPQWTPAHLRWSGILVGATCVLLAGMRDPGGLPGLIFRIGSARTTLSRH